MKKCKRWIAVVLVSVMCLSLCGCQNLEDMRAAHAFWQEDGSILWNGNVYRLMSSSSEKMNILFDNTDIWVTEKDVPVLLSETFGQSCRNSNNGAALVMYGHEGAMLYCREDMYDFMTEQLQDAELNTYYYTCWDWENYEEQYYYLSEVQGNTIDRLLANSVFEDMDEDFYDFSWEDDFVVTLGKCDAEHLFANDYMLEIARKGGKFYLITPDCYVAEVPAAYDNIMIQIVSVYYNMEIAPYL